MDWVRAGSPPLSCPPGHKSVLPAGASSPPSWSSPSSHTLCAAAYLCCSADKSSPTEHRRPKDALCLSFPGCKSRDRAAQPELMGAGSLESTGSCLQCQTPLERSSCPGRRQGWLPAALAPHSWVEGAGGRLRAGGSQVGTACGGVTPGHGAAGQGRERCEGSRGIAPGRAGGQEMLEGKLLFRHLKGCKARVKRLLGGNWKETSQNDPGHGSPQAQD